MMRLQREMLPSTLTLLAAMLLTSNAPCEQMPPIGSIEFYGLRSIPVATARAALGLKVGDSLPESWAAIEARLRAIPGVAAARLNPVCCEAGKTMLYVGVREKGAPTVHFRPAPEGAPRLPAQIVAAGNDFEKALMAAVRKGDAAEDDSQGHSLSHNPELLAIEERYVGFAATGLGRLRDVLRHSGDPEQRALAAEVLGYAADKRAVVPDLEFAMSDPDSNVRNNAMRALWLIAKFAQEHPDLGIQVDPLPFVALLNSLVWTDRNKSSLVLGDLTQTREPRLLASLRAQALPALIEMAGWKNRSYAGAAYFILGRVAGLPEKEIAAGWERNDRRFVIPAAQRQ